MHWLKHQWRNCRWSQFVTLKYSKMETCGMPGRSISNLLMLLFSFSVCGFPLFFHKLWRHLLEIDKLWLRLSEDFERFIQIILETFLLFSLYLHLYSIVNKQQWVFWFCQGSVMKSDNLCHCQLMINFININLLKTFDIWERILTCVQFS